MSSDLAMRVEGLAKRYTIRHKDHDHITLAQAALHRMRHPRGALGREEFWALRDVSFEVHRGEVLGVIGHNGAGKSTLLKVLSRITPPTAGRVEVFGRIGSLLEVGTGFHPELTGRENVYLNGSILGMRKREIDRQFDAIVDFSGVEQFLDTPVKRYSSGMYVRLAFAVAAHLDTEILLLDEVLAVGDPDFQQRSVAQIKKLARDGRTVLFVSHNPNLVTELTTRTIAFAQGRIVDAGPPVEVLARQQVRRVASSFRRMAGLGTESRLAEASGYAERSADGLTRIRLTLVAESLAGCHGWRPNFTLRTATGVPIGSTYGPPCPALEPGGRATVTLIADALPLAPGTYSIDVSVSTRGATTGASYELADVVRDACAVSVPELREGSWDREWGFLSFTTRTVQGDDRVVSVGGPPTALHGGNAE